VFTFGNLIVETSNGLISNYIFMFLLSVLNL